MLLNLKTTRDILVRTVSRFEVICAGPRPHNTVPERGSAAQNSPKIPGQVGGVHTQFSRFQLNTHTRACVTRTRPALPPKTQRLGSSTNLAHNPCFRSASRAVALHAFQGLARWLPVTPLACTSVVPPHPPEILAGALRLHPTSNTYPERWPIRTSSKTRRMRICPWASRILTIGARLVPAVAT